jgi:hypothetical protein
MKVFSNIDPVPGEVTLRDAFKAIVELVKLNQLATSAWSLAELGADEEDFGWLCDWARCLDEPTARRWLQPNALGVPSSYRAALGSLLILFAAEYTRRALPRESAWDVPVPALFAEPVRAHLFSHDEPTPAHCSALREAAQRLRLRHSFLGDDAASQRESIALQIGFTEPDIWQRLPLWLVNEAQPPHIQKLLDENDGSSSFRAFWCNCRRFQNGNLAGTDFRASLADSPWVLPGWIDLIVFAISNHALQPAQADVCPNRTDDPPGSQDIFISFSPYGGIKTLIKAARALMKRVEELQLRSEPWSLVELRATDYDYSWLRVWIKQLEPFTVWYCEETRRHFKAGEGLLTFQAGLGCVLLLWLAETARRKAVEGELWPHVAADYFAPNVQGLLFTQGQPTRLLREMLQAAATGFNLRHVLNVPGVQRWLDTIFLQFGFTQQGFKQRLPEWLAGQATTRAVSTLLDEQTGSGSFRQMWEGLRAYRRNQITQARLRETLADCPWVLPEWVDELITLAQAPLAAATDDTVAQPPPDSFLTQPALHWPIGGEPHFVCQIATDLLHLNLTEACYDLHLDGRTEAQLLRQANGSYLPVPSRAIAIAFNQPLVTASLTNQQGETVASCDLELWPQDEDVVIYRLPAGVRFPDAFTATLNRNVSYALLTAPDLTVEPEPQQWRIADSQRAKLYRLHPSWPAQMRVLLDGELLWEPHIQQHAAAPPWANQVGIFTADNRAIKWGKEFRVKIIHPPDVTVRYVRCQGRAIDFSSHNRCITFTTPPVIKPDPDSERLNFRLGLQKDGQRCTVRRQLELSVIGAAHLAAEGWRALNKHSVLTVEQAKRDLFKIALPTTWDGQPVSASDLVLLEGDSLSHKLPRRAASLGELHGWGAPLKARRLFNAATPSLSLAGSVVNHGVLDEAICEALPDTTARLLRLRFRQQIEPSEQHAVVWWDASGQLLRLTLKSCDEAEGAWWWVCELSESCATPLAVAVAYEGRRLGARWEEREWLKAVPGLASQDAKRAAALLRWFHLPLLSSQAIALLRPLAEKHAVDFLRAWLLDEGLPDEMKLPPKDEAWLAVVRALFHEWRPDAETARRALMVLAEVETETDLREYLPDAARHLCAVDPLLLAKVLKAWQGPQRNLLIDMLRLYLAECDTPGCLNQRKQQLLNAVVNNLDLASPFVTNGVINRAAQSLNGARITQIDENNLAVAARYMDFRLLLALHLFEYI